MMTYAELAATIRSHASSSVHVLLLTPASAGVLVRAVEAHHKSSSQANVGGSVSGTNEIELLGRIHSVHYFWPLLDAELGERLNPKEKKEKGKKKQHSMNDVCIVTDYSRRGDGR